MAVRENDKRYVWIVSPIREDDGEIRIIGYTRLRKLKLGCVQSTTEVESRKYGDEIRIVYRFGDTKPIDVSERGGDGIYFEEPVPDEKGLYQNPTLISTPLRHFGKQYSFNGEYK